MEFGCHICKVWEEWFKKKRICKINIGVGVGIDIYIKTVFGFRRFSNLQIRYGEVGNGFNMDGC